MDTRSLSTTGLRSPNGGAFHLTEVRMKNGKQPAPRAVNPKMDPVRDQHRLLNEVVESFGHKVNMMVDKQRVEYMQAYEQHMYDVQKELHSLRDKVTEIANDRTRDEKIEKLSADQVFYRREALTYDEQSASLRKKIRTMKDRIQNVEKERDWFLTKLREHKEKYDILKREVLSVSKHQHSFMPSLNQESLSHDSEFSLELQQSSYMSSEYDHNAMSNASSPHRGRSQSPPSKWKSQLEKQVSISRSAALLTSTLPIILQSNPSLLLDQQNRQRMHTQGGPLMNRSASEQTGMYMREQNKHVRSIRNRYISDEKMQQVAAEFGQRMNKSSSKAINDLIKARRKEVKREKVVAQVRRDELRGFLKHCQTGCGRGIFSRVTKRSLDDVLRDCEQLNEYTEYTHKDIDESGDVIEDEETVRVRRLLARELASFPDVYASIMKIIIEETRERNRPAEGSIENDDDSDEVSSKSVTAEGSGPQIHEQKSNTFLNGGKLPSLSREVGRGQNGLNEAAEPLRVEGFEFYDDHPQRGADDTVARTITEDTEVSALSNPMGTGRSTGAPGQGQGQGQLSDRIGGGLRSGVGSSNGRKGDFKALLDKDLYRFIKKNKVQLLTSTGPVPHASVEDPVKGYVSPRSPRKSPRKLGGFGVKASSQKPQREDFINSAPTDDDEYIGDGNDDNDDDDDGFGAAEGGRGDGDGNDDMQDKFVNVLDVLSHSSSSGAGEETDFFANN